MASRQHRFRPAKLDPDSCVVCGLSVRHHACARCGEEKEPTRINSRLCRACDHGGVYTGRLTNYLVQGALTDAEIAKEARARDKARDFGLWYGVDWAFGPEVRPVIVSEMDFSAVEERLLAYYYGGEEMERQFVAVVFAHNAQASQRSAFSGTDKDQVIQKAIEERSRWMNNNPKGGPYRILVGSLTEEVVQRPQYDLRTLPIRGDGEETS